MGVETRNIEFQQHFLSMQAWIILASLYKRHLNTQRVKHGQQINQQKKERWRPKIQMLTLEIKIELHYEFLFGEKKKLKI